MSLASADEAELLARAFDYPYAAPDGAYLFRAGEALPLPDGYDLAGRLPVLAHGSNRAPAQLLRKFGREGHGGEKLGPEGELPVTPVWLTGYDVVFSAQFALYGALPATLHPSPGTRVRVHVTWLTEAQREIMDRSEGLAAATPRYRLLPLPGCVACDLSGDLPDAPAYLALTGALAPDGAPVAFTSVRAEGRRFEAMDGRAMIARIAREVFQCEAEALIRRIVGNMEERDRATALLERLALKP
ncbi:hypothetical protein [Oceanibaculum indicum]|uniref:Uncharacterized protein n=1 Tax=Oceanibaculum indicum TaxID=526216 RepID=A0A420WCQ5_9PROT|nr:hypothetical protein [Oceanibaculum indicum]RKQ68809.1 hypothetical protein BCL74_3292 [Oceanibaculum indicum]